MLNELLEFSLTGSKCCDLRIIQIQFGNNSKLYIESELEILVPQENKKKKKIMNNSVKFWSTK